MKIKKTAFYADTNMDMIFSVKKIYVLVFITLLLSVGNVWAGYWIYTWTGNTDTNWDTATNWTGVDNNGGTITPLRGPNGNGDVAIIPSGLSQYPVISSPPTVNLVQSPTQLLPHGPATITIESGASLTINSGITLTCGTITINGALTNNGTLISKTGNTLLTPTPEAPSIGNIINNGRFITSGTVSVAGTNAAEGTISGTGTYTLGGTVTTTSTQTYTGAVTLDAAATLNSTNSAVVFNSTVNAITAGTQSLAVNAGTGTITFTDAVGGGTTLASLSATAATIAVNGGTVTTNGAQTYTGSITLGTDSTLDSSAGNGNISFNGTINGTTAGAQNLTVNAGTGTITYGGAVGGGTRLASLSASGSTIAINGSAVTTHGVQTYTGAVTLGNSPTLDSSVGNGNITFSSIINGTQNLIITAGIGNVTFTGIIGGTTALGAIVVNSAQDITANAAVSSATIGMIANNNISINAVTTTGLQTYTGAGTVSQAVGTIITTPTTLTLNGSGTYTLNEANQVGALSIANQGGTADGAISFKNAQNLTVSGVIRSNTAAGANVTIDITSPATNITFSGVVTLSGNNSALTIPNASLAAFNGNVTVSGTGSTIFVPAAIALEFNGGTLNTTTITVPATSFTTVTGTIYISNRVTFTNGFTQAAGGGAVTLAGTIRTTAANAGIRFTGAVELAEKTEINTSTANGDISFLSAIDSAPTTPTTSRNLNLTSGTGSIVIDGIIGDTHALANFIAIGAITNTAPLTINAQNVQFGGNVTAPSLTINPSPTPGNVFVSGVSTFAIGATPATTDLIFPANLDLFIAANSTNAVNFSAQQSLQVLGSFVLFGGTVTLPTATTIAKDFVALNGAGSGTLYNGSPRIAGTSVPSVTTFPTTLPGGGGISATYSGAITDLTGKTITVNTNFYASGVNLNGTAGNWTLNIPDNQAFAAPFAEASNLTVHNCIVGFSSGSTFAWVAAGGCTATGSTNTNDTTTIPPGDPLATTGWATVREFSLVSNDPAKTTGDIGSGTYTIYDDVIRVEFNTAIKNTANEITAALQHFTFHSNTIAFSAAFTDPECTISTNSAGDLSVFYLRTGTTHSNGTRWNTDAIGTNAGAADSTDRGRSGVAPAHRTINPALTIRANNIIRDRFKNGVTPVTNHPTADRCRPVLVEMRLGQETHTAAQTGTIFTQKPYDAHNFIELRFSEPVNIYTDAGHLTPLTDASQNMQVNSAFGAIDGLTGTDGIQIAGLTTIAAGRLRTGARSDVTGKTIPAPNEAHSLYRSFSFNGGATDTPQTHRVRISIAGWQDGTISSAGSTVPYYAGFIDEASAPSGTVTVIANPAAGSFITDRSTAQSKIEPTVNDDTAYGSTVTSYPKAAISVNTASTAGTVYGTWDISPPELARSPWGTASTSHEIVGADTVSDGFVNQFEFHFFDNKPDYSTVASYNWAAYTGWYNGNTVLGIFPDTIGGSRQDWLKTGSPNTIGGIRAASLVNVTNGFNIEEIARGTPVLLNGTYDLKITALPFFGNTGSLQADTLYLALAVNDPLAFTTYDDYRVLYDDTLGFITDLAGNRLKSNSPAWNSIDRTPPKISLTVTPLDEKRLLVVFNKQIKDDGTNSSAKIADMWDEFIFNNLTDGALTATTSTLSFSTRASTGIILTLSRPIKDFTELTTAYISLKPHPLLDPVSGRPLTASNIADTKSNWMDKDTQAPLTYFGINVAKPLLAFNALTPDNIGNIAVNEDNVNRNFDGTGRLFFDRDITMQAGILIEPDTSIPAGRSLDLFIDTNPTADSVSVFFNINTGKKINLWLPTTDSPNPIFAPVANTKAQPKIDETYIDPKKRNYTIPYTLPNPKPPRAHNDMMQFLFQYGTIKTPDPHTGLLTIDAPFYLIRLTNPNDLTSLGLFEFKVLDVIRQRGGSTILNNVINTNKSEKTILEIVMQQAGNLNISVMTIDGNIIKYLHRGRKEVGKWYFEWDGKNGNGQPVARGMYFVRISGSGIDETRKVMVVRD